MLNNFSSYDNVRIINYGIASDSEVTLVNNCDHLASLKFSRTTLYAFTEHGATMAASVLSTPHAIEVSVLVVRTFVKLRQMLAAHKEVRHKLVELERKVNDHDGAIRRKQFKVCTSIEYLAKVIRQI